MCAQKFQLELDLADNFPLILVNLRGVGSDVDRIDLMNRREAKVKYRPTKHN